MRPDDLAGFGPAGTNGPSPPPSEETMKDMQTRLDRDALNKVLDTLQPFNASDRQRIMTTVRLFFGL